jgi:hypothetical protein
MGLILFLTMIISFPVIIHDLDIPGIRIFPPKAGPPTIVNSDALLSLPVPLHQQAEKVIDSGLIAAAGSFQPSKDIRINSDCDSLLFRPIELADDRVRWYFSNFRDIGEINFPIRAGGEFLEFLPFFSR